MTKQNTGFEIPSYSDLNGEDRTLADQLVDRLDWRNPESLQTFGQKVCDDLERTTSQIIAVMRNQPGSIYAAPMENLVTQMSSLDLDGLMANTATLARKGLTVAKKHRGKVTAVAGLLTGSWILAAAGAGLGAKDYFGKKLGVRKKSTAPTTIEEIEERMSNAIISVEKGVNELRMAQHQVPTILNQVATLNKANGRSFNQATLYICAGREYARRLSDDIIPELRETATTSQTFDTHEDLHEAEQGLRVLNGRLVLLESLRAGSAESSVTLRNIGSAIRTSEETMTSLLTSEVPAWQRDMAMAGVSLDTIKIVQVAERFRDNSDRMREDSIAAAQLALASAERGRLDNPERLQAAITRMDKLRTSFLTHAQNIATAHQQAIGHRETMERATTALLTTLADATSNPSALLTDGAEQRPARPALAGPNRA